MQNTRHDLMTFKFYESVMSLDTNLQLERRKAEFDQFFQDLMPKLVDFVGRLGINFPHHVLKQAAQYLPYVDHACSNMTYSNPDERAWLLARIGYFIGEYFVQQYGGCWYVNDIEGSKYFARYVVGKFTALNNPLTMVDPFSVAQQYVDTPVPRRLEDLVAEVTAELTRYVTLQQSQS